MFGLLGRNEDTILVKAELVHKAAAVRIAPPAASIAAISPKRTAVLFIIPLILFIPARFGRKEVVVVGGGVAEVKLPHPVPPLLASEAD